MSLPAPTACVRRSGSIFPNSLEFAGVPGRTVEVIDVNRHAAEKLHALCRHYGDRENSRVRDLIDIVLLHEHGLLDHSRLSWHAQAVWSERGDCAPPYAAPSLPASWPIKYEDLASTLGLGTDFNSAEALLREIWACFRPDAPTDSP